MKGRMVLFFIAVILFTLIAVPMVWAGPNEARDLVAPYAHFAVSVPPATGPFTTHYLISSTTSAGATVNVKCYSDLAGTRVGPAAGTNVSLGPFDMDVYTPITLGLTTDPAYTGYGWCYFAVTSGDDVAVAFIAGLSVGNNLITTNDSKILMSDTAQSMTTLQDANIPYWTKEGSWNTHLLALNPTATGQTFTMNVYNASGVLQGTFSIILSARDLDFLSIPDAVGATGYGNADIGISGPLGHGFVGWVAGVNYASFQGFIYPVPLDKDDVSLLGSGDRP